MNCYTGEISCGPLPRGEHSQCLDHHTSRLDDQAKKLHWPHPLSVQDQCPRPPLATTMVYFKGNRVASL
ncbi:hypothetical protein HMPREF9374_1897 [Desmospora sp. 8437]|nr:hypothetical protein HMPREF9374_1897 [Desmospora sp. 8437]